MNLAFLYQAPEQQSRKAIFLIHGYGSSDSDLFQFAPHLPKDYHIFSLRGPYSLGFEQFAWYAIHFDENQKKFNDLDQASESLKAIKDFIDTEKEKLHLDQIDVMGFSQGCILSLALALNHPGFFKRLIGLSGYLNLEMLKNAENIEKQNTAFFLSHGIEDAVIPFAWAIETKDLLLKRGLNVEWHEYPTGHTVSYDNFKDLIAFLSDNV